MTEGIVIKALPDDNMGAILVVNFTDLAHLKDVSKNLLQVTRVDRLDLLVLLKEDKALFRSAGPQIESAVPWHINNLHKLNRPLQTMGGPPLHGFVVTSSRRGEKNCLALDYQIRKLPGPGVGAVQMEIAVPDFEHPTFAVVAEDRAIPGIVPGMGPKGAQCASNLHRTVKGARIVRRPLTDSETEKLIKAYKGCFFAVLGEEEILGEAMSECPNKQLGKHWVHTCGTLSIALYTSRGSVFSRFSWQEAQRSE